MLGINLRSMQGFIEQAPVQRFEEKDYSRKCPKASMVQGHRLEPANWLRQQQERISAVQAQEAEHQRPQNHLKVPELLLASPKLNIIPLINIMLII